MPLYDYDCANCGRRFEVIHGVHADPPTACPLCGGGPIKKAIAAPAIHFKGSGWAKKERRATAAPGTSGGGSGDTHGEQGPASTDASADAGSATTAATSGEGTGSGTAAKDGAATKTSSTASGAGGTSSTD